MHRIDAADHDGNQFTDGDPGGGIPATVVGEDWLNDVQEELCGVIEEAGLTLVKGTQDQLLTAIRRLVAPVKATLLSDGAGNATVESGYGVASVSISGTGNSVFRAQFDDEFADRAHLLAAVMGPSSATGDANTFLVQLDESGDGWTTHGEFQIRKSDGTLVDLAATAVRLCIQASGELA